MKSGGKSKPKKRPSLRSAGRNKGSDRVRARGPNEGAGTAPRKIIGYMWSEMQAMECLREYVGYLYTNKKNVHKSIKAFYACFSGDRRKPKTVIYRVVLEPVEEVKG